MSTAQTVAPQSLFLDDVPWKTYSRLLREFEGRHLRFTYDRGMLEIKTLTYEETTSGWFLSRLIAVLTEELSLPIKGGGSTTFRRRRKQKGLEPDNCFWIANEHVVRGKTKIDLRKDAAPDLAVEIDITPSSLNRMGIYAALGVSEVWRFDGRSLAFHGLSEDGKYVAVETSKSFPGLAPAELLPFLMQYGQQDENTLIRQFRTWVRQRFGTQSP